MLLETTKQDSIQAKVEKGDQKQPILANLSFKSKTGSNKPTSQGFHAIITCDEVGSQVVSCQFVQVLGMLEFHR